MRHVAALLLISSLSLAQSKSVTEDKAWTEPTAVIRDSLEAEVVIRTGDVDNLGFGWPEGFDPFCGRMTDAHQYPWDARDEDLAGFDRILLGSKYDPRVAKGCGGDGYSGSYDPKRSKPVPVKLATSTLRGVTVSSAFLQIFIDDFQAPSLCSKFQITLNGHRFVEADRVLNAIDQTGPVGKLITIPIPEDLLAELASKPEVIVTIDEVTGAPDGFAIDFVRLLINRRRDNTCKGTIRGVVVDKESGAPLAGAWVALADRRRVQTDAEGRFELKDIPTGFEVLTGSLSGYSDGTGTADVGPGEDNAEVTLPLEKGKTLVFGAQQLNAGDSMTLKNILFDQSKADVRKDAKPTLDSLVVFLKANPTAEIELSGHTSSEGEADANRSLSYRRVKACKDYLTSKGIDAGRVLVVGFGEDRPVATNDTEPGRKLNRRVELRLIKS